MVLAIVKVRHFRGSGMAFFFEGQGGSKKSEGNLGLCLRVVPPLPPSRGELGPAGLGIPAFFKRKFQLYPIERSSAEHPPLRGAGG